MSKEQPFETTPEASLGRIKKLVRCSHTFGPRSVTAQLPNGQKQLLKGVCTNCENEWPAQGNVEVQDLSPYALYLIAEAVAPLVAEHVVRRIIGKSMGNEAEE